jgi:hypothetical protein
MPSLQKEYYPPQAQSESMIPPPAPLYIPSTKAKPQPKGNAAPNRGIRRHYYRVPR